MSEDVTWASAGDLLGTLELVSIPETCTPLEAIVLVKALDEDGSVTWFTRETESLTMFEPVGALNIAHALRLDGALNGFISFEDDYDEEDDE